MPRWIAAALTTLALSAPILRADQLTLFFDPNDLVDAYSDSPVTSSAPKTVEWFAALQAQQNPRRIWETAWASGNQDATWSETGLAGYQAWLSQLGVGEGISAFSLFLTGVGTSSRNWGEMVAGTTIGVAASSGWIGEVYPTSWGGVAYFHTSNPDLYLRPGGADLGNFFVTLDNPREYNTVTGLYDLPATASHYRIWAGAGPGEITDNLYSSGFEAALDSQATPEPGTWMLLLAGAMGLPLYRRFRRS